MGIIALVFGMFSMDTQEFRETMNQQMNDGYKWEYVGKQKPALHNPSLTLLGNVYYKQKCVRKDLDK